MVIAHQARDCIKEILSKVFLTTTYLPSRVFLMTMDCLRKISITTPYPTNEVFLKMTSPSEIAILKTTYPFLIFETYPKQKGYSGYLMVKALIAVSAMSGL